MTVEITLEHIVFLLFVAALIHWARGKILERRASSGEKDGMSFEGVGPGEGAPLTADTSEDEPRTRVATVAEEDEETEPFPIQIHIYGDMPAGVSADAAIALAVRGWRLAGAPRIHTSSLGLQVHSTIRKPKT